MSLSKIVISGRVTRAPEKRFTQQNMAVTEFVIAVESVPRNDAPPESAPVRVLTYRDLAERCATEIRKGDLVAVDGRLQINNSQGSDGQRKRDVEIDAVAVENLSAVVGTGGSGSASEAEHSTNTSTSQYKTPVKAAAKPAPPNKGGEDLDAIFASDDEIPF
jgi:single-strand DNA-binding protein